MRFIIQLVAVVKNLKATRKGVSAKFGRLLQISDPTIDPFLRQRNPSLNNSFMALLISDLQGAPGLNLLSQGKVRDIYSLESDPDSLLFIASDRISAYDVILKNVRTPPHNEQ